MNYEIKKLTPATVKDLIPLYKETFGKDITEAALQQKLNTAFTGLSHVGFTAYDEHGNAAAFYGVFPCFVTYDGNTFLVAQSGDTMTHPRHQGKGLFTLLAKETYQYCKENGVHLVFGFPNENSYPGFVNKLGWEHFDDIEAFAVRVRTISFYRLNQWFSYSEDAHQKRGHAVLSKLKKGKPFPSSCAQYDVPVVDHSEEFFKYKTYAQNYLVEVAGVNCWLKFDKDFLVIGDMEMADEHQWNRAIVELKKTAARMLIPHLRFQGSTNTPLAYYFKKIGQKLEVTHAIGGINFSNTIPLEKMKFTAADNDTF